MKKCFVACIAALSLTGCLEITEQIAGSPPDAGTPVVTCTPKTCAELNATCGAPDDGCGHSLGCGVCAGGFACSTTRSCVAIQTSTCSADGFCLEPGQLTTETLLGVYAVDDENVWVVGENGTVLHHTASAGWKRIALPVGVDPQLDLHDVKGFEPDVVWLVGENGTVLRYDARPGAGWTRFSLPQGTPTLTSIFGSSSSNIYVAGASTLLHFDGTTWTAETGPANVTLRDGAVLADGRLVVLADLEGATSLNVRAPNGSEWTPHSVFSSKWRLSVCPNGNVAVFGSYSGEGGHAQIFETTGWTETAQTDLHGGGQNGFDDGICTVGNKLWGVGSYELAATDSQKSVYLVQNSFKAIDASPSGVIWAVGTSGTIYRVGPDEKGERMHGPLSEGRTVLTGSSRSNVWLLSTDGSAEHFDGTSWTTVGSANSTWGEPFALINVEGVALEPNRVSMVGNRRLITEPSLYTFDGSQWQKEAVPFPPNITAVHLGRFGKSLVTVYRGYDTLETFTLIGNNGDWTPAQTENPYVLSLSSENELVAVSELTRTTSALYRWTSSGWSQLAISVPFVKNTWLNGPLNYAATAEGLYVNTHLGWQREEQLPNAVFTAVQGTGPNDIWAASYHWVNDTATQPQLFHFDGTKWSTIDFGSNVIIKTLYVSPTDVWALGYGGALLHKAR
ncbi:MAG: hypothetical protein K1X64_21280 [Myxococcaceae bacterium]|nr:hypothetical protein [Myxococcaceae bacterium]